MEQYGYVTTAQALEEGVTKPALSMLVKRGRLERVAFGVYRVPQIAHTQYDRYMLAILWTGVSEAVLSHETALDAYAVCDINPTAIHVTVNRERRIRRSGGDGYVVHHQTVDPKQVGWWEGIPIVKLSTAIDQCIDSGVPSYLLDQAITQGARRGLLVGDTPQQLREKVDRRHGR